MSKPMVLNKYKSSPSAGSVYVGRPSKFGNPFKVTKPEERGQIVDADPT